MNATVRSRGRFDKRPRRARFFGIGLRFAAALDGTHRQSADDDQDADCRAEISGLVEHLIHQAGAGSRDAARSWRGAGFGCTGAACDGAGALSLLGATGAGAGVAGAGRRLLVQEERAERALRAQRAVKRASARGVCGRVAAGLCRSAMPLFFISSRDCRSLICFSSLATRSLDSLTALSRATTSSSSACTRADGFGPIRRCRLVLR